MMIMMMIITNYAYTPQQGITFIVMFMHWLTKTPATTATATITTTTADKENYLKKIGIYSVRILLESQL